MLKRVRAGTNRMEIVENSEAMMNGEPVTLMMGDRKEGLEQPDNFRVCPLGIQLYSPKEIPEFELLELNIRIPGPDGTEEDIACTGVIVHCRKDPETSLYRVWAKFIDLPESKREQIQCVAKSSDLLCPFCENF